MEVVDQWTGRHARAFQLAARMTQDDLADLLGVARRTIAAWHERPNVILRPELQRAFDTAYDCVPDAVKVRFARQLRGEVEDAKPEGGVVLSVAIAVVLRDAEVLLVRRRVADPHGLTWQFPAGVVKPGATAADVAVRETLAETGVHCSVRGSLGNRLHPATQVHCEYFLCDYLAGTVENLDPDENLTALWVPAAEATRFIPADKLFDPAARALEGTI